MLNALQTERYIATTAARGDMRVKWEDTSHPRTDGKTVFLPRIGDRASHKDWQRLRHYVSHEVDHVLYSDFELLQEVGLHAENSVTGAVWNVLEDNRIEWLGGNDYEGDRLNSNDVYEYCYSKFADRARDAGPEHPHFEKFFPLIRWINAVYNDLYPNAAAVEPLMETVPLSAQGQSYLDKLNAGNYADVLRSIRNIVDRTPGSQATLDLAKRIAREVYDVDPDEEKKKADEQREKEQQAGEGQGEGDPKDGKGKGKAGPGGDKEAEGDGPAPLVDYKEYIPDAHDSKGHNNMSISYDKHVMRDDYVPAKKDDYAVTDYTEGSKGLQGEEARAVSIRGVLARTSDGFAQRVRTLLQIMARDKYQYGLKKGRLNVRSLYRVTMKDAPGFNERVFKRKIENNILDAAVTILVDTSGSMGGSKYDHAAAACAMLSDTIGNTLHIPLEILGFTTQYHMNAMHIYRDFNDKLVGRDTLIDRLAAGSHNMGSNGDGDAIMFAYDRLMRREEKRKVLIVLSDGQPAGGVMGGDIVGYTDRVVKRIEKESPVNIVGIGIMDTSVSKFYKQHMVINNPAELENALLSVVQKQLK